MICVPFVSVVAGRPREVGVRPHARQRGLRLQQRAARFRRRIQEPVAAGQLHKRFQRGRLLLITIRRGQVRLDSLFVVVEVEQRVGVGEVGVAQHGLFDRRQFRLLLLLQQPCLELPIRFGRRLQIRAFLFVQRIAARLARFDQHALARQFRGMPVGFGDRIPCAVGVCGIGVALHRFVQVLDGLEKQCVGGVEVIESLLARGGVLAVDAVRAALGLLGHRFLEQQMPVREQGALPLDAPRRQFRIVEVVDQ